MPPSQPRLRKEPFARKVWHRLASATRRFFFASGAVESGDHLVEVVRRDPAVAAWFIQFTSLFSIAGSVAAAAACVVFLSQHWHRCGTCARPLRMWLVGQVSLQMSQIPVRAVLCASIHAVSQGDWTIEACILSLTASPAWRLSKMVSLALYGWFVLGVVWWMHSGECTDCVGINTLIAGVLLLSASRTVVTLVASRGLFSQTVQVMQAVASTVEPATRCQIDALPLVPVVAARLDPCDVACQSSRHYAASFSSECLVGEKCAVCLSEFELGEHVRRLPCYHHYHSGCIDRWLLQNKRCPLCMHPIDEACAPHHLKSQ